MANSWTLRRMHSNATIRGHRNLAGAMPNVSRADVSGGRATVPPTGQGLRSPEVATALYAGPAVAIRPMLEGQKTHV